MLFLNYVKTTYDDDLGKFYKHWQTDSIPYLSGDVVLEKASFAGIASAPNFLIVAYIEVLLLRSVCIYDTKHLKLYHSSVRFSEKLGTADAFARIRNPQTIFANLAWTTVECVKINEAMIAILPLWAKQYDTLIKESGAGKRIINSLQYDKYIFENTDNVSNEILQAIKVGLFGAAKALGIIYLFQKPLSNNK